ncbi:hypothetical protein M9458_007007, partial [Cirrhinus mrigala]
SYSAPPGSTGIPNAPFSSLFCFDNVRESVLQLKVKLEDFCNEEIKKICEK